MVTPEDFAALIAEHGSAAAALAACPDVCRDMFELLEVEAAPEIVERTIRRAHYAHSENIPIRVVPAP